MFDAKFGYLKAFDSLYYEHISVSIIFKKKCSGSILSHFNRWMFARNKI